MKNTKFGLIGMVLAAVCLPLQAQTLSATLNNGMRVVVKEDKRVPVAVSQLWYRVGSQDEHVGKTGLSHALEHMMFKGTDSVPAGAFSRKVAAWGGNDNAYTSREVTVYHQTVAAKHLPDVLAMEADRMVNLNFSDADFDNEMKVIREERRLRTDDNPAGKLWELMYQTAYTQPYNRAPVIGYMADLHSLAADDLRQWYRQWYAPNNATLVVVGDVDAAHTIATVKTLFGALPAQTLPSRHQGVEPAAQKGAKGKTSAPSELPMLTLMYSAPRLQQLDDTMPYALTMLYQVLDGDGSARLQKHWVRQQPLAVAVGADYNMLTRGDALFTLSGYPAQGVSVDRLQAALQREIASLAKHGITEAELARVRTQAQAACEYAKDSMAVQASIMGSLENAQLGWQAEDQIQQRLLAVGVEDVQRAAQFLQAQKPSTVVLKPEALTAGAMAKKGDAHVID